ncbi:uncharacterized protein [Gorilla gorilla gorilla]|uniref:uncharacterized protein isoform X2 n=1 Tax=Gorilla gorilla gorilla TaxID=9595 RepID=UPI003008B789
MLEAGAAGARLASLRLSAVTERDQRGWSGDVLHLFNLICSLPCRPVDEEPESSKPNTAQLRRLLSYQEQVLPKCFLKIMRHLVSERNPGSHGPGETRAPHGAGKRPSPSHGLTWDGDSP